MAPKPTNVAIALGSSTWNDQASSPGNSSNVPRDRIVNFDGNVAPTASVPFWDKQIDGSSLDPSNASRSPWDVVSIGGWELPGRCRVKCKRGRRIDVKKQKGTHYATLVFNGYDPADVIITCTIWSQAQLDVLERQLPLLEEPPVQLAHGAFQSLQIQHPALQLRGVTQVLIQEIGSLEPGEKHGSMDIKIHAIEYKFSRQPASKTVNGAQDLTVAHVITGQGALITPGNDANFTGPPLASFQPP